MSELEDGGLVERASSLAMQLGDAGRETVIWVAVIMALWQVLLIARHFLFQGGSILPGILLKSSPRVLNLGQPLPEDGRSQLFGNLARDTIEMGFWTIKFIEDFEKEFSYSHKQTGRKDDLGRGTGTEGLYNHNARTFLKLMRYMVKFVGTYDRFTKNQKKN